VAITPAPTETELHTLRHVIRDKMISSGTYADWARKSLGNFAAQVA
jgi:hypothetical protein